MCVSTALIAAIIVAILAIAELFIHQTNPNFLTRSQTNVTETKPDQFISIISNDFVFLAIVAVLGLLAVVSAGLLLHLCFFHIYISFLGLTTYEYIRDQRQQQSNSAPVQIQSSPVKDVKRLCSTLTHHRPSELNCVDTSQLPSYYEKKSHVAAFFSCALLEESCVSRTNATSTSPVNVSEDCHTCVTTTNVVTPAPVTEHCGKKRLRQRWNCCASVPDSPEDPHSPNEPRCLINLCRYKVKRKRNVSTTYEGRRASHHGPWTSAKIRVLFRVINNLRQNRRRNQIQISPKKKQSVGSAKDGCAQPHIQTVSNLIPIPSYPGSENTKKTQPSSALPPLPRRRIISETELADALGVLQQQQQQLQRTSIRRHLPQYRRRRRSFTLRPKSPALSPIRESGLSNPASPSHQQYSVPAQNIM